MEPEVRHFIYCVTVTRAVSIFFTFVAYLRRSDHGCLQPIWFCIGTLAALGLVGYIHAALNTEDLHRAGRLLLGFGVVFDVVFFFRQDLERLWAKHEADNDDDDLLPLSSPPVPPTRWPWTRRPAAGQLHHTRSTRTIDSFLDPPPRYREFAVGGEAVIELGMIDPAVLHPLQDDGGEPHRARDSRR